jgi:hypothetical protein
MSSSFDAATSRGAHDAVRDLLIRTSRCATVIRLAPPFLASAEPAVVLAWRLDTAETIGAAIAEVPAGGQGAPGRGAAGVPPTTARSALLLGE